jgi:hypothetical protein
MENVTGWRNEHELLILFPQVPFDAAKLTQFEEFLEDPVDRETLIEACYAHAVTVPLL